MRPLMNLSSSSIQAAAADPARNRPAHRIRGLEALGRVERFLLRHGSWVVLLVALALRLLYLTGYRANPFFADPQMDALYHDRWALQIARGEWVGEEVFFRAPLYAYLLGAIYALSDHSYWVARVVQAVMGSISCLLVLRIGQRLLGRGAGVVAGILAAFLASSVYYEAELLLVVLETLLFLLALERLLASGESDDPRRLFVPGLMLGLAAICRPNALVFLAPAGLYLLARRRSLGRTRWILALAFYLGGVATPIVPVTLRNYLVGQDFVPIASQGGLNFYLGNNPAADGMAALAPEFRPTWYGGIRDAQRLAEEATGRPLKPSEVSDFWLARGLSWARHAPTAWFSLQVRKFVLFWQSFEIPNNEDFYFFSRYSFLFRGPFLLTFGAVAPLGIAGLVLGLRRRQPLKLLTGFVLTYALSISIFFVCGRFRAPIVPFLCIPAAGLLVEALDLIRRRRFRPLLPGVALFVALAVLINADLFRVAARHTFSESWLRLGSFHAARGRLAEAEAAYRSAISADPGFAEGYNNLGVLLMQQEKGREAREMFDRAFAINATYPRTLNNLAAWYEQAGNLTEARVWIDRALEQKGDEIEVLYNAGIIYGRLGDFAAAESHFRRLLQVEPGHIAARVGFGKSLLMLNRPAEAERAFRQVVERDRRQVEAWYFLGVSRLQQSDNPGARVAFEACLVVRPDYEPARRQLEALVR